MGLDVRNRFLFNTSICGGNFREFRPVSKRLTREAESVPVQDTHTHIIQSHKRGGNLVSNKTHVHVF